MRIICTKCAENAGIDWCLISLIPAYSILYLCGCFRLIPSGVWSWRFDWPASSQPAASWSHSDPPPVGWGCCFRWQQCGAQCPQLLPCGEDKSIPWLLTLFVHSFVKTCKQTMEIKRQNCLSDIFCDSTFPHLKR